MLRRDILSLCALFLMPAVALSNPPPKGSADAALAMMGSFVDYVEANGIQAGLDAVRQGPEGPFSDGAVYVFVVSSDAEILAHGANPALEGLSPQTTDNQIILNAAYAIMDVSYAGQDDWAFYSFENPTTGKVVEKATWVKNIDADHVAGVGFYD